MKPKILMLIIFAVVLIAGVKVANSCWKSLFKNNKDDDEEIWG